MLISILIIVKRFPLFVVLYLQQLNTWNCFAKFFAKANPLNNSKHSSKLNISIVQYIYMNKQLPSSSTITTTSWNIIRNFRLPEFHIHTKFGRTAVVQANGWNNSYIPRMLILTTKHNHLYWMTCPVEMWATRTNITGTNLTHFEYCCKF